MSVRAFLPVGRLFEMHWNGATFIQQVIYFDELIN
jgi:hypothetical protein